MSSSLLLSSLELSDTKVYEPLIRALFGTTSHCLEAHVRVDHSSPGVRETKKKERGADLEG